MPALITISAVVLVLIFGYIFLIAPRFGRKFGLPRDGYAHRGLWSEKIPENSIAAFKAAIEAGFAIETDVQLTADGVPVIFHDNTLKRMCGVDRRVDECSLAELENYRLKGTDEKIPKFTELLETVDRKVPLLIELKGVTANTAVCDATVEILDRYKGEFVIESFNPILLGRVKKLRPEIIRGQLVTARINPKDSGNRLRGFVLSAMLTNCLSRPDFVAYNMNYPKSISLFVATRLLGAKRCAWTVKNETAYKKLKEKGNTPIFDEFTPNKM